MTITTLPPALAPLTTRKQFVGWRYEARDGKQTKVLVNWRTGRHASSTDPKTWGAFAQAAAAVSRYQLDGIGFVVTATDHYTAIDLDHCVDPLTGTIAPWAQAIVTLCDSYTEITPSGTGLRIIITGTLPPGRRKVGHAECYDQERFVTITGNQIDGSADTIADCTAKMAMIHAAVVAFGETTKPKKSTAGITETMPKTPAIDTPTLSDSEVIDKLGSGKDGAKYRDLFAGNWQPYFDSQSGADQSLMNRLEFLCGGDTAQMERIFSGSVLGQREKWTDRADYRTRTIAAALAGSTGHYSRQAPTPIRPSIDPLSPAAFDDSPCADKDAIIADLKRELDTMRFNHELERRIWHREDLRAIAPTAIGCAYVFPASASHGTKSDGGIFYSRASVGDRYGVKSNTVGNHAKELVARGWFTRDTDPSNNLETGEVRKQAIAYPAKRCATVTEYLQSILELPEPKPRVDPETGESLPPKKRGGNQRGKKPEQALMPECPVDPEHEVKPYCVPCKTVLGGFQPAPSNQNGDSVDGDHDGRSGAQGGRDPLGIFIHQNGDSVTEPRAGTCPICGYLKWRPVGAVGRMWACTDCRTAPTVADYAAVGGGA